ncbi:unnamed protein product [Arabidopsis lyrata]|nr:unnamed protein product [Arabidopsis lyrata]
MLLASFTTLVLIFALSSIAFECFFLMNHDPIRSTKRKDLISQTTTGL